MLNLCRAYLTSQLQYTSCCTWLSAGAAAVWGLLGGECSMVLSQLAPHQPLRALRHESHGDKWPTQLFTLSCCSYCILRYTCTYPPHLHVCEDDSHTRWSFVFSHCLYAGVSCVNFLPPDPLSCLKTGCYTYHIHYCLRICNIYIYTFWRLCEGGLLALMFLLPSSHSLPSAV